MGQPSWLACLLGHPQQAQVGLSPPCYRTLSPTLWEADPAPDQAAEFRDVWVHSCGWPASTHVTVTMTVCVGDLREGSCSGGR